MGSRWKPLGWLGIGVLVGITTAPPTAAQGRHVSPRDTSRATIGGAKLMVDYGRPSKRGRVIFDGLVPYGRVWRTGANQATHVVTELPLVVGKTTIPAGAYTLWTIPDKAGWTLIINKQTGQWGTDYNEASDLVRLDMEVEVLPAPVEQLTIKLVPTAGRGGALRIEWDRTGAVAQFSVSQ